MGVDVCTCGVGWGEGAAGWWCVWQGLMGVSLCVCGGGGDVGGRGWQGGDGVFECEGVILCVCVCVCVCMCMCVGGGGGRVEREVELCSGHRIAQ